MIKRYIFVYVIFAIFLVFGCSHGRNNTIDDGTMKLTIVNELGYDVLVSVLCEQFEVYAEDIPLKANISLKLELDGGSTYIVTATANNEMVFLRYVTVGYNNDKIILKKEGDDG